MNERRCFFAMVWCCSAISSVAASCVSNDTLESASAPVFVGRDLARTLEEHNVPRPSPIADLLQEVREPAASLEHASESQLARYGSRLRELHQRADDSIELIADRGAAPEISSVQRSALESLAVSAWGKLRVRWNDARHAVGVIENIGYARRNRSPRAVWSSFLSDRSSVARELWGVRTPDELLVTEEEPLGTQYIVLRGGRSIGGIPVDGEFFEAIVTSSGSHLVQVFCSASMLQCEHHHR